MSDYHDDNYNYYHKHNDVYNIGSDGNNTLFSGLMACDDKHTHTHTLTQTHTYKPTNTI